MAKRGQPPFQPTDRQRGQVEAMARYGIPEAEISRAVEISEPTLRKHFRGKLDTGLTKANAQVGEFIFSTIIGVPIPGRPQVTDERARVTAALFWAKTRMAPACSARCHKRRRGSAASTSFSSTRTRWASWDPIPS